MPTDDYQTISFSKTINMLKSIAMEKTRQEFFKIEDFHLRKTRVNLHKLESLESKDQYVSLSLELLRESGTITALLAFAHPLDNMNKPRNWTRDEAILCGLMVRLVKLQLGVVDAIKKRKMEIEHILMRCLAETAINLRYLLLKGRQSKEIYEGYVQYSLHREQRLLDMIDKSTKARGQELPIERQMRGSILKSFKDSGFTANSLDTKWQKRWSRNLFDRARATGMEDAYLGIFGLPSHAVHGNWEDLLMYHVERCGDEFIPRDGWAEPQPEFALTAVFLSCESCEDYLNIILPECDDRNKISGVIKDLIGRTLLVIQIWQRFSEKH